MALTASHSANDLLSFKKELGIDHLTWRFWNVYPQKQHPALIISWSDLGMEH
jgi:hypothetical protein